MPMVLILFLVESLPPLTQDVRAPTFRGSLYGTLLSLVLIFLLTVSYKSQCDAMHRKAMHCGDALQERLRLVPKGNATRLPFHKS